MSAPGDPAYPPSNAPYPPTDAPYPTPDAQYPPVNAPYPPANPPYPTSNTDTPQMGPPVDEKSTTIDGTDQQQAPYPTGTSNQAYDPNTPPPAYSEPQYPTAQQLPGQPYYSQQPPPPGGVNQVQFQNTGSPNVIVTQPRAMVNNNAGPLPQLMPCASCNKDVTTVTSKECSVMQWLGCGGICFAGLFCLGCCWLGCCLIPFCIPSLYNHKHKCPECQRIIGYHKQVSGL